MGSPESDAICDNNTDNLSNTRRSSETTAAQDSPIFGYICNLSPIQPFKDAAILQGFPGITSPPNVFTSPRINPQSSFLNRQPHCHTPLSGFSRDNGDLEKTNAILDDPVSTNSQSSIAVESSDQKGSNAAAFKQLQPVNTLVAVDELFAIPVDEQFIDTGSREHLNDDPKTFESNMEKNDSMKDNCLPSETSTMFFKQPDEYSQRGVLIDLNHQENHQAASTSEVCSDRMSKPSIDHAHVQVQREYRDSGSEVNHIQSGILRRCLQFGERQQKCIRENSEDKTERQNRISDIAQNLSPETPYDRHVAVEFPSTMCMPASTSVAVSKPRGIGLHLNSIVAGPPGDLRTGKKSSKGMVKLEGKSLILPGGIVDATAISSSNVEIISSISEGDPLITEFVEMATPNKLQLPNIAKPLDFPILPNPGGELVEFTEESNQAGSITRRKQASSSANPDGCKRCSCKKSKCLKLYCDCFAAGLYCADSCSCQGCFNRPEHKDTVVEARQIIETRNPLAFAPKIMQHVANSPTNSGDSGEPVGQSSLRHKRGCNCRKSMCLKKYCECYEANVGCSDGCRCEGCKNVYGKKPDYSLSRQIANKRTFDEMSDKTSEQKRKLLIASRSHLSVEKGNDTPTAVSVTPSPRCDETPKQKRKLLTANRSHLSVKKGNDTPTAVPVTPSPQCSDSRKNEMKSLRPGRRYVLSPEPNLQHTPPSAVYQSSSGSSMVQHKTRNLSEPKKLTPSVHGKLVNLCHVVQLTNPVQMTSSNTRDRLEASQQYSSHEIVKSKNDSSWPGEDDTPVILRDSSVPAKSVKVSSPNKKRVSPPHNHLNEVLRPSVSGEMKSSRKYIFRSVPKFPPLSPCLNTKDPPTEPPADTHNNRSINS